jgi:hypothetical protein
VQWRFYENNRPLKVTEQNAHLRLAAEQSVKGVVFQVDSPWFGSPAFHYLAPRNYSKPNKDYVETRKPNRRHIGLEILDM